MGHTFTHIHTLASTSCYERLDCFNSLCCRTMLHTFLILRCHLMHMTNDGVVIVLRRGVVVVCNIINRCFCFCLYPPTCELGRRSPCHREYTREIDASYKDEPGAHAGTGTFDANCPCDAHKQRSRAHQCFSILISRGFYT